MKMKSKYNKRQLKKLNKKGDLFPLFLLNVYTNIIFNAIMDSYKQTTDYEGNDYEKCSTST